MERPAEEAGVTSILLIACTLFALWMGVHLGTWEERRRRGLLGLVLDDVRALPEIVPCKGALGFWEVPPDVQALVDEQLRRTA